LGGSFLGKLSAQAELRDEASIPFDVLTLQVLEQTPSAPHKEEQPAPRVVVFGMGLGMLGQVGDAPGKKGYLDLGRTRVSISASVLGDDPLLLFFK
jgi:hypothetical protein